MTAKTKEEKEFLRQLKSKLKHINPYEYAKEVKRKMQEGLSEEVVDRAAMKLRTDPRIVSRWMGYTGAKSYEDINWEDPCVFIEWCACDITIQNLADDPEEFIGATGCDRETFMRYYWPKAEGA